MARPAGGETVPLVPLVPIHPEPVTGDERALRWVIPPHTLDFVGPVDRLPATMQPLVDDGTLESVSVEPGAVLTRLGAGQRWQFEGARVRTALQAALATPTEWAPVDVGRPDDLLRTVVQQVIDGEVGDYVRSHGGAVELGDVRDGYVELKLTGTCTHCPAADFTLSQRLEVAVRALYPDLRGMTARADSGLSGGRRLLGLSALRRR